MSEAKKLWGGRFTGQIDPGFARYNRSFGFDRRLFEADVRGSLAHCEGLRAAGVLGGAEAADISRALKELLSRAAEGGDAFFAVSDDSVGTVRENSFSTFFTTLLSCFADASKKTSRVSLEGCDPVNCGGDAFLLPFACSRFQLACLASWSSLGLNWKSSWNICAPGAAREPSLDGSCTSR